jgi:hypothetical protein
MEEQQLPKPSKASKKQLKLEQQEALNAARQEELHEDDKMRSYDQVTLDIQMGNRASTTPLRNGIEGYAVSATVIKIFRRCKVSKSKMRTMLNAINWRELGNPNHHVWFVPSGSVKPGDVLNVECVWEADNNFRMHILINGKRYV